MWALHFEVGAKADQIAPQCQQRLGKDQVGCDMGLISNGMVLHLRFTPAIDSSGLRRRVARHRESAVVLVVFQNADLQVVQFASHRFRTHRMSERLEPVTHVLHTAIGHETDGDMGSDAPACPMKDRRILRSCLLVRNPRSMCHS